MYEKILKLLIEMSRNTSARKHAPDINWAFVAEGVPAAWFLREVFSFVVHNLNRGNLIADAGQDWKWLNGTGTVVVTPMLYLSNISSLEES